MNVINTWDQLVAASRDPRCRGGQVGLFYHGPSREPGPLSWAHYAVILIVDGREVKTDPKGAWYAYGRKLFNVDGPVLQNRTETRQKATAWAREHLGVTEEFIRNRMGDYVPATTNKLYPLPERRRRAAAGREEP